MAQSRQWSFENGGGGLGRSGVSPNRVSIGVRYPALKQQQQSRFLHGHHRRFKGRQLSAGAIVAILSLVFVTSVLSILYFASQNSEFDNSRAQDDEIENNTDFLTNVPRIQRQKDNFGHELTDHGNDDAYDSGIDSDDTNAEGYNEVGRDENDNQIVMHDDGARNKIKVIRVGKGLTDFSNKDLVSSIQHSKSGVNARRSSRKSKYEQRLASRKKAKRRPCDMKLLNSTELIVEPVESQKFARFSLQYTEREYQPIGGRWEPRFSGHQSLAEREESFLAQNQKINCGFVKGPEGSPSTGFDMVEDDARYISSCHIAVVSCIFGNSDRLRTPVGKLVSRFSRKNVCFVMFVDEGTLQTLSSEGHMLDSMGFIGLWKIVVVKNFPYDDMRRVGKIPKFLSHRLFTSARYSIWLDSKLRLQLDPLLILEYFLWRRGHEYAISNHYDRHCVWEEVAQNKKLNKYNHTIIDQQFQFYRDDGLERFNASDPDKLLPSNVPEGSLIVRAHTPMSNLFSCLWFNEVDRFTPRDQLSFAYTYFKLRRMNPGKPFYLNMFKDCARRKTAKLFRHRDIVNL
ncbi:unnamed protein product [Cuscuta campestris]|uniref:TOD1/MUCI70 glycosyltransferase-like domain-containing protein n=1 Tax=Cuscuta campestris TaxID=132261 RepID=A0A484MNM6_9ASTE|nr:unnamed protein product [Cuscuta campestris]